MLLDGDGLERFLALREAAITTVSERFFSDHPEIYQSFGQRGREACREDLAFTLDFLRPALEFGTVQPFVDYVLWLREVLATRAIPVTHVPLALDWLGAFYREHLPEAAAAAVTAVLDAARAAPAVTTGIATGTGPGPPEDWPEFPAVQEALLAGDRKRCLAVLRERLAGGAGLLDVELRLVQPALYQVGRDWQANRISVAQEHLATATAYAVLAQLAIEVDPAAPVERRALLACVPGNNHALGLRMVADAFELGGWEVHYLGADVPIRALCDEVDRWRPHLVGLSVSMPYHLATARETIAALRAGSGAPGPAVLIGGFAINSLPAIAPLLGAAASGHNAAAALEVGTRLAEAGG